jgi:hypothetical protein
MRREHITSQEAMQAHLFFFQSSFSLALVYFSSFSLSFIYSPRAWVPFPRRRSVSQRPSHTCSRVQSFSRGLPTLIIIVEGISLLGNQV